MEKNVGKLDAIIRYGIAAVLVILAIVFQVWWLLIPAAIAVATAALGRCGLYKLIGVNTCKVKNSK